MPPAGRNGSSSTQSEAQPASPLAMPLLVVSPNLPDAADSPSRKRSHEAFLGADPSKSDAARKPPGGSLQLISDIENREATHQQQQRQPQGQTPQRAASPDSLALSSPISCSPLSLLTDAGSSSLTRVSPSPNPTPSRPSGPLPELVITLDAMPASQIPARDDDADKSQTTRDAQPPTKRKRLTAAEREEKAKADAARKLERERQEATRKQEKERIEAAKKQERDEKNAAAEAKKKALAEEREKKRRQREEEEQRRAERNEEKEKRRKEKEDEERKIQEAKQKKERSQLRLNSFFRTGPTTAAGTTTAAAAAAAAAAGSGAAGSSPQKKYALAAGGNGRMASASPQKATALSGAVSAGGAAAAPQLSEYDRIFRPFFIKENVVMATSLFGLDDDAKKAKAQTLDQHVDKAGGPVRPLRPFSHAAAVDYFQLPCCPCSREQYRKAHARGRTRPTVRKIMGMLGDGAYGGGGAAAQQTQAATALGLLRSVPMKYLAFREDVRPPYYGTVTSVPPQARLAKLARNPLAKTVLPLSYDYDSEAEWVDDGDGEDVDDLDDDEELEPEEDEEMADFLDDSEDNALAPPRPAFSGGMEPESTGLCWENEQKKGPLLEMESYRMEMILNHDGPIDPLSTHYWEPPQPVAEKPAADAASGAKKPSMRPPPTPSDAFVALLSGSSSSGGRSNGTEESPGDAVAASVLSPATKAAGPASSTGGSSGGGGSAGAADGSGGSSSSKKAAVGVAEEHVADLKKAVLQYAKLSKLGLVEMLSVEFLGKCTKSQIKASVEALAERTGPGQHKTWKLKE